MHTYVHAYIAEPVNTVIEFSKCSYIVNEVDYSWHDAIIIAS